MKTIVIVSELKDSTTDLVSKWVLNENAEVIRIDIDFPELKIIEISTENLIVFTNFGVQTINKDCVVWFRRAMYFNVLTFSNYKEELKKQYHDRVHNFIEFRETVFSFLKWLLINCKTIANPFIDNNINKIEVLEIANSIGIQIPKYCISSSKEHILNKFSNGEFIAVKYFNSYQFTTDDNKVFQCYTNKVSYEQIENYKGEFANLIFQEYIEKKYELRIFFIENKYFAMAIFSQGDSQTSIDFRKYNFNLPNRTSRATLPKQFLEKLKLLSKKLKIITGSYDVIVDKDDNFILLEVNPNGQFGMVSFPCYYNIEYYIAKKKLLKCL